MKKDNFTAVCKGEMLMYNEAESRELTKQAQELNKLLKGKKAVQDIALCLNRNW